MDKVRSRNVRNDPEINAQGLECSVGTAEVFGSGVGGHGCPVVVGITGRAERPDMKVDVLRQHPAELGNVDTGTAINFRREFFSHNVYSHANQRSRSGVCVLV
ncbi:hypothetical protein NtRootD5_20710 [Arthrobacter sp. NtRootD5]|nr:hypothetical protein NtRootC45_20730 [Arthrobacter sp. NtRootC45]BCW31740.1 hypothetical protein NtRootD5_20710 [Arthrobacter sp. NtRootD5]